MLKGLFSLMSPAGPRARLSVLIFHRVLARPDPLSPDELDAARFEKVCAWLAHWFSVLPLDEAVRRLTTGTLPARALSITFDDGYADNHDVALPILQRHGLSATFFVATGFLDGGRMWNDTVIEAVRGSRTPVLDLKGIELAGIDHVAVGTIDEKQRAIACLLPALKYLEPARRERAAADVGGAARATLPGNLMMSGAQVRALHRAGMQVGAHTVSHPILAGLPAESARDEVLSSRSALEDLLQEPVTMFAYPNGKPDVDFRRETTGIVRSCGFAAAVTTSWGVSSQETDVFELPRFTPWDGTRIRFGARLLRNLQRVQTGAAATT